MSTENKDNSMQQELDEAIEELHEDKLRDSARSTQKSASKPNLELIMGIPVDVQVVLGGTTMPVANLMKLGRGAVITLDKQIGDPVDIVVNGRVIARGEVIVLEDDSSRFGVSLTEIIGK
ncbi:flagellar motor switch protein FliN [Ochrobactrum sp. CM-21-5]|nr:flagellar motor switch protein FliN [Ochrobactrum sp. CM-21-5]MBC2887588.1 flagellar motor switch protein FliN [Ochrobactrum sp. CM-21-5]